MSDVVWVVLSIVQQKLKLTTLPNSRLLRTLHWKVLWTYRLTPLPFILYLMFISLRAITLNTNIKIINDIKIQ